MSKKPPPQVLFNFKEDDTTQEPLKDAEIINPETGEENPNFIYEDEEPFKAEDQLLKVEEKEKINEKDIFNDFPDNIAVMPDKIREKLEEEALKDFQKPTCAAAKPKKKRKPMSEEHKAKLGLAREKAMIARKAKAEENKKMKALEKEEKELLKTQKIKRVKKLKAEVNSDEEDEAKEEVVKTTKTTKTASSLSVPTSMITKKDLEDAQLDAIMKYEAMRKQRKKEKKEAELVDNERKKMLSTIQKATGEYRYRDGSNRFDNCY